MWPGVALARMTDDEREEEKHDDGHGDHGHDHGHGDHDHGHGDDEDLRVTSPMQEFTAGQVRVGLVVLLAGLAVTFGVPLLAG